MEHEIEIGNIKILGKADSISIECPSEISKRSEDILRSTLKEAADNFVSLGGKVSELTTEESEDTKVFNVNVESWFFNPIPSMWYIEQELANTGDII